MKNRKLLNSTLAGVLFLLTTGAMAAKYCKTNPSTSEVIIPEIYIPPGATIGEKLGESDKMSKTIECEATDFNLVAYTETSREKTDVSIPFPEGEGECFAMESGYPGIGIVWMNYNSLTRKWLCASTSPNNIIARGLGKVGNTVSIEDKVVLVKTGDVAPGIFDFNKTFSFEERKDDNPGGYLPNFGNLYTITLRGSTIIEAPVCTVNEVSKTYRFNTVAATGELYSEAQDIDIACTGVVNDGDTVSFLPKSEDGIFGGNYFASSIPEVGVKVKYKLDNNVEYELNPNSEIKIPIFNNVASLQLLYSPLIIKDSGNYPTTDDVKFNFILYKKE